jgi:ribonuclease PH
LSSSSSSSSAASSSSEKKGDRKDKRNNNQLRPMECEHSVLTRADGSVKYSQGNSSVMVAVYGPVQVLSSFFRSLLSVAFSASSVFISH